MDNHLLRFQEKKFLFYDFETFNLNLHDSFNLPWQIAVKRVEVVNNNGIKKLITITNFVINSDINDNKGPCVKSLISWAFLDKYNPYDSEKLSEIAKDNTLIINIL